MRRCICGNNQFFQIKINNPKNKYEVFSYNFCKKCQLGTLDYKDIKICENYNQDYTEYEGEKVNNIFYKFLDWFCFPREKFVKKYSNNYESIFDIGCGNGSFLKNTKNTFKEIYGSEINYYALSKASKKLTKLNIVNSDLSNFNIKVSTITLWHVLEHIANLEKFLTKIKKNMNLDTRLIIEVPNSNSINFKIFKESYLWTSLPEHIYYFNEPSIKFLLEKLGFSIVVIEYNRLFPLLFSKHLKNKYIKILTTPISVFIFIVAPFFKGTESLRIVCKLKN